MAAGTPLPGVDAAVRLCTGEPPSVVVFAGEETFLAEEGLTALRKRLFPSGEPAGAFVELDASQAADADRVASVIEELGTPSLFGDGKLVVIRRAEMLGGAGARKGDDGDGGDDDDGSDGEESGGEAEVAEVVAPAAPSKKKGVGTEGGKGGVAGKPAGRRVNPITGLVKQAAAAAQPGAVLVLVVKKPVRGRGSVSADAIMKTGALLVDCRRLYDAPPPWARGVGSPLDIEVIKFLTRRAKAAHGKALDPRAAQALCARLGASLAPLARALETLSVYVGDRPEIAEDDVAATTGTTREDPAWVLADAVLERDVVRSLDLVASSFDRGLSDAKGRVSVREEAIFPALCATLHGAWRRAMLVAEATARGDSPASLPALAGLPSFVVERILRQAARRDPDDLLARHAAFVDAEAGVRGGGVPPRLALERLIVTLTR